MMVHLPLHVLVRAAVVVLALQVCLVGYAAWRVWNGRDK